MRRVRGILSSHRFSLFLTKPVAEEQDYFSAVCELGLLSHKGSIEP